MAVITVKLDTLKFFEVVNALRDSCGCKSCLVNADTLLSEFRLNFNENGEYKGR